MTQPKCKTCGKPKAMQVEFVVALFHLLASRKSNYVSPLCDCGEHTEKADMDCWWQP